MSTITVSITEDSLPQLKELALNFEITPEQLVRLSVEDLLAQPNKTFQRAVNDVLDKNSKIYHRLAA
jgi:hypothetical protein